MLKQQVIMEHIRDHYEGWKLSGDTVWRIAAECEVARSTVYRAIKKLLALGNLNDDKRYAPRVALMETLDYLRQHSIAGEFLMTDNKRIAMAKALYSSEELIIKNILFFLSINVLAAPPSGHVYGWRLRVVQNA